MPGASAKRKGARGELRAKRVLEAAGFHVVKAGGSLGAFDLIALGPQGVRCVQVKTGGHNASPAEREAMKLVELPAGSTREVWRWLDYAREPVITYL